MLTDNTTYLYILCAKYVIEEIYVTYKLCYFDTWKWRTYQLKRIPVKKSKNSTITMRNLTHEEHMWKI